MSKLIFGFILGLFTIGLGRSVNDAEKNLTSIDWAHAVNDKAYLEAVLASDVAMLEADIVLGHIIGSEDGPLIPIMAHPPANTSDLSLAQFLQSIEEFNNNNEKPKGVKLDFKSIEAFEASQKQIEPFAKPEVTFPLWLNADILPGPVEATGTPVDPHKFLNLSAQHQRAVLSIGWTTKFGGDITKGEYTKEQIGEMVKLLRDHNVKQTVTFPVRAGIAAFSEDVLQELLRETSALESTLTIWSGADDPVDADRLRTVMLNVGLDKTYLDVPDDLEAKLHLPSVNKYCSHPVAVRARIDAMFRLSIVVCVLIELIRVRTAVVTEAPETLAEKLDKIYEKLERFTLSPEVRSMDRHYAKLDRLNSLNPERVEWPGDGLTDEEEELLSAMQQWGAISPQQLEGLAKELQEMRSQPLVNEKLVEDDVDDVWGEDLQELQDEVDYAMDGSEDGWDTDDDQSDGSTAMPKIRGQVMDLGPTESVVIRPTGEAAAGYRGGFAVSTVDPIAATAERPRLLDDSSMGMIEKIALKRAALTNMGAAVRASKCLTPQPRWLAVRQMAPAANTVYMPPCVQLHRCASDSGCCDNEGEVCAPIDGKHVAIALFIKNSDGDLAVVRMLFYNHTSCACVSRDAPREILRPRTPEPMLERDDELALKTSPPPEMRRCTCPGLFLARSLESGSCTCVCDWPEASRRRDCFILARGREHFGLRDRVCVARGDCTAPSCDYGLYDRATGRCPLRRFRRVRYQLRNTRFHDKPVAI